MSGSLAEHADRYLQLRRALGFKLERHGRLLPQFVTYLETAGARTITRELAVAWAQLPIDAQPKHWAARLSIVRGFAVYVQTIDPATEIPRRTCSPSAISVRPRSCGPSATSAACSTPPAGCDRG